MTSARPRQHSSEETDERRDAETKHALGELETALLLVRRMKLLAETAAAASQESPAPKPRAEKQRRSH